MVGEPCLGVCAGEGGVYTLRDAGGGDDVELDLLESVRCNGGGDLGPSSRPPFFLRLSNTIAMQVSGIIQLHIWLSRATHLLA